MSDPARELRILPRLSLRQLRVFFFLTGCIVVGAVLSLSYVIHNKMAEAARDREEMIAARVFDDLEREISAFLDQENARTHYQDLYQTDPELWAPFVVGYFRDDMTVDRSGAQKQVVAADGATSENKRRVAWALARLDETLEPDRIKGGSKDHEPATKAGKNEINSAPAQRSVAFDNVENEKKSNVVSPSAAPGSKIIESLNRAPERRKQQVAPTLPAAPKPSDPFNDYAERY